MRHLPHRTAVMAGIAAAVLTALTALTGLTGCGGAASPANQRAQTDFVTQVRDGSPDIERYRSDAQLIGLGHAVCDDFSSGASYQQTADRLIATTAAVTLPSEDLGVVITSAVDVFCPRYRSLVS